MKSQISVEFLVIFGLVLLMLTPLWITLYTSIKEEQENLRISSTKLALSRIVRTAELVYIQGHPAETTVSINLPSGIINYSISTNETSFRVSYGSFFVDVVEPTKANISGFFPIKEGTHKIRIKAEVGGYVNITSVS